jgi:hypothetical protein
MKKASVHQHVFASHFINKAGILLQNLCLFKKLDSLALQRLVGAFFSFPSPPAGHPSMSCSIYSYRHSVHEPPCLLREKWISSIHNIGFPSAPNVPFLCQNLLKQIRRSHSKELVYSIFLLAVNKRLFGKPIGTNNWISLICWSLILKFLGQILNKVHGKK